MRLPNSRSKTVPSLGPLEARAMAVVWRRGDATVRDVADALSDETDSAYTTVLTIMTRLVEKRMLKRTRSGRAHVYRPTLTRQAYEEELARGRIRSLISEFGDLAVAQFAEELQEVDPERARQLGALLRKRTSK
ncbi:MAG: BlaI/MecI/CopY family transcriptional regulator [Dehalococcoidia bacterium]